MSIDSVIPEAEPFEIFDSLGQSPQGSSMNIAGLLAVIDAWNEYQGGSQDPLRCACSLVKPRDQQLVAVGSIREKIDAFEREVGKGSLVICTNETSERFRLPERFDCVWLVECFGDLADRLSEAGLLAPLFRSRRLTEQCVVEAWRMLGRLKKQEGTKAALNFASRLNLAATEGGVESRRVQQRASEALEDFNRHIGNFEAAARHSQQAVETLHALGNDVSFQEEVEAKARLAAALYDAHQFPEAIELLNPLLDETQDNPRRLTAESRVMLFNTYARLLVVVGMDGWESLYRESLRLQEAVQPTSIGRTRCYLVHGLLRMGRTAEAKDELCWFDENNTDSYTASFAKFYRADLYRRDPSCGPAYQQDDQFESEGRDHPFGFYLQATARQFDRDPVERSARLRHAAHVFREEIREYTHQNLLQLFSLFVRLASQPPDEATVLQEIEQFFDNDPSEKFREWYSDAVKRCIENPEQPLDRVPYF